jgi:hypothetical protein
MLPSVTEFKKSPSLPTRGSQPGAQAGRHALEGQGKFEIGSWIWAHWYTGRIGSILAWVTTRNAPTNPRPRSRAAPDYRITAGERDAQASMTCFLVVPRTWRRRGRPRRIDVRTFPILPILYNILQIWLLQPHHFVHGTDRIILSSMDLGLFGKTTSFLSYRAHLSLAGKSEKPVRVRS